MARLVKRRGFFGSWFMLGRVRVCGMNVRGRPTGDRDWEEGNLRSGVVSLRAAIVLLFKASVSLLLIFHCLDRIWRLIFRHCANAPTSVLGMVS
jgi:hypothetical protein